jgi:ribonuclease-3
MPGTSQRARIRALLKHAGAPRVDPAAVATAFVHASAVTERLDAARGAGGAFVSNERLEFLGDSILGFVTARWLWRRYPDAAEGELTLRKASLVSDAALSDTAERLGLAELLVLGQGQSRPAERLRASRSILAGAFEAFLAALYLVSDLETVAGFVEREHAVHRERLVAPIDDPKTTLQEWVQMHHRALPRYALRFEGPAQERTYFAQVSAEGEVLGEGSGPSKKAAERVAAAGALEALRVKFDDLTPRKLTDPVQSPGGAASKRRRP